MNKSLLVFFNGDDLLIPNIPDSYQSLIDKITFHFEGKLPYRWILQYADFEGDKITLSSENDFRSFIRYEVLDSNKPKELHIVFHNKEKEIVQRPKEEVAQTQTIQRTSIPRKREEVQPDSIPEAKSSQETCISVSFETLESKEHLFTLEVEESTSFHSLKAQIQKNYRIPYNKQVILLENEVLDDQRTLSYYRDKIKNLNKLILVGVDKKITVKICRENDEESKADEYIDLYINYSDSISDLKVKIQDITEIPYDRQAIYYKGEQVEDKKTLGEYDVKTDPDPVLFLQVNLLISVKDLEGKAWCFSMKKTDHLEEIKKKIYDIENIHPDRQILTLSDMKTEEKQLENTKTLSECMIKDNTVLDLAVLQPIQNII